MSAHALAPRGPLGPAAPTPRLEAADEALTLTLHARKRLDERQIQLSAQDWADIQGAVAQAAAKSAKKALVLMRKAALVVSVPNRAVITVMDPTAMHENLFLNIDSAVIL